MKLRPPCVPLITVDPYFSVWSPADNLTEYDTVHWTGRANLMLGVLTVDGVDYRFMGRGEEPAMRQVSMDFGAMSTDYVFEAAGVRLSVRFLTPLLLDDLSICSRPVGYIALTATPIDGKMHELYASISLSEQFCLDKEGDSPVVAKELNLSVLKGISLESANQKPLQRAGDNLRIEWGRVCLAAEDAKVSSEVRKQVTFATGNRDMHAAENPSATADLTFITARKRFLEKALFLVAYDDGGQSLELFGKKAKSVWNMAGTTMEQLLFFAANDYDYLCAACDGFSDRLYADAVRAGGEKYAELLLLAYRQAISAHKIAVDEKGEIYFISKENFSNGCAATVDVSYPSIPLFLLYRPDLVQSMLRPIYDFARSPDWIYDFAPHDAGTYPLVNGQVYGYGKEPARRRLDCQMPVEECGNMLVMEAAAMLALDDASFAESHLDLLRQWVKYLLDNGADPDTQLCTDDFAGHLAHNCNLSLKAIMGIASMGLILRKLGKADEAEDYLAKAKAMADSWRERAANGDGTYRLAFDCPGTTSMKYNIVWDKLFGTKLMPETLFAGETAGALHRQLPYGLPLDCRKAYTKSDWLVWQATLASDKADFEALVEPLWLFYNTTPGRVPMTDWYWTDSCYQVGFQARSVIGGLFMKLLADKGIDSYSK